MDSEFNVGNYNKINPSFNDAETPFKFDVENFELSDMMTPDN